MAAADRRLATIGLTVFAVAVAACADFGPPPSPWNHGKGSGPTPPIAQPVPIPVNFPPLTGPSRVYGFKGPLEYQVRGYTTESRFVLYDNGGFDLQYAGLGIRYGGRYTETNGRIEFEWHGSSSAGPWGAVGTLNADTLVVRYNSTMMMSDFEDAVYVR